MPRRWRRAVSDLCYPAKYSAPFWRFRYRMAGKQRTMFIGSYSDLSLSKARAAVKELAAEYFNSQILPRWKHPDILRRRIDKDINPHIGNLKVEDVKPRHIDAMLQNIVARGAPTVANDVLRWTKRIFDYAIKRHAL